MRFDAIVAAVDIFPIFGDGGDAVNVWVINDDAGGGRGLHPYAAVKEENDDEITVQTKRERGRVHLQHLVIGAERERLFFRGVAHSLFNDGDHGVEAVIVRLDWGDVGLFVQGLDVERRDSRIAVRSVVCGFVHGEAAMRNKDGHVKDRLDALKAFGDCVAVGLELHRRWCR